MGEVHREAEATRATAAELQDDMSEWLDTVDLQPMTILEILDIWNRY